MYANNINPNVFVKLCPFELYNIITLYKLFNICKIIFIILNLFIINKLLSILLYILHIKYTKL